MYMLNSFRTYIILFASCSIGNLQTIRHPITYNYANFRFLAIGDTGGVNRFPFTSAIGRTVAKTMSKWATEKRPQFVLMLGDNIYNRGASRVNDPRFKASFEDLYSKKILNMPWYVIAGNHDHLGNVQAEIDYTGVSKRWKFLNNYYDVIYEVKLESRLVTIQIVAIDTMILCGKKYFLTLENLRRAPEDPVVMDAPWDYSDTDEHWEWLVTKLNASKADYLIVMGHYPVYSIGSHGPDVCLLKSLRPLLIKYKVTAYLCGHDHNQQHLSETVDMVDQESDFHIEDNVQWTLHYLLFGSGSKVSKKRKNRANVPRGMLKYFGASDFGGFGSFEFNEANGYLRVDYLDGVGNVNNNHTMRPRF